MEAATVSEGHGKFTTALLGALSRSEPAVGVGELRDHIAAEMGEGQHPVLLGVFEGEKIPAWWLGRPSEDVGPLSEKKAIYVKERRGQLGHSERCERRKGGGIKKGSGCWMDNRVSPIRRSPGQSMRDDILRVNCGFVVSYRLVVEE